MDPAGSIIVSLASMPDFLRRPILQKRMREFYSASKDERDQIVRDALAAAPSVPFDIFERLFATWLDVLAGFSGPERQEIFSRYLRQAAKSPAAVARLHLDGVLGVLLSMDADKRDTICASVRGALDSLDARDKKVVTVLFPDSARSIIWS